MIQDLALALEEQVGKGVRSHGLRTYIKIKRSRQYEKRTGQQAKSVEHKALVWSLDPQFNPFKVRKRITAYARALSKAVESQTYKPRPALNLAIPKPDGKKRIISQYTITDAAVARWLYRSLIEKNLAKLSPYAYAFRLDRNAVMAAEHLIKATKDRKRFFIVEYDFKNFFDEVNHKYLLNLLANKFDVSSREMFLIKSFLTGSYALGEDAYQKKRFKPRLTGIPQGCTLSLFLANAVFHELDSEIQALGLTFARYADDIAIVCDTYSEACKAALAIFNFSKKSGIPINLKKSEGIHLVAESCGEMRHKSHFEFLGYRISCKDVRLSGKRKAAIKQALSLIIFENLLKYPKKKQLSKKRIVKEADWDIIVCLNELRKRIYGRGINEEILGDPITPMTKTPRSIVSNHPLVNIDTDFVELDGWLRGCLAHAIGLRHYLARSLGIRNSKRFSRAQLTRADWYKKKDFPQDIRLPSLCRAWLYARKYLSKRGSSRFPNRYSEYD
jgi:RNA-directed DNA polymerase